MTKNNLSAGVSRHNVTMDDIHSYVNNNIVKLVFFDKEYADLSTDTTINEIHKFKSKYRANTFINVPLKLVKSEDEKYVHKIDFDEENENPRAFAVVSKHDLREVSKEMKKAKKDERIAYGKQLCTDYVNKLNFILTNHVYHVQIRNADSEVLYEENVPAASFQEVNKFILDKMNELNK